MTRGLGDGQLDVLEQWRERLVRIIGHRAFGNSYAIGNIGDASGNLLGADDRDSHLVRQTAGTCREGGGGICMLGNYQCFHDLFPFPTAMRS